MAGCPAPTKMPRVGAQTQLDDGPRTRRQWFAQRPPPAAVPRRQQADPHPPGPHYTPEPAYMSRSAVLPKHIELAHVDADELELLMENPASEDVIACENVR